LSTILQLFADNREALYLTWLAGEPSGPAADTSIPWNNRFATPDLVGYLNLIHPARIQVLGVQEIEYLSRFAEKRHRLLLSEIGSLRPPAVLVAEGLEPPAGLTQVCEEEKIPLLGTPLEAARVIEALRHYLARTLTERTTVHGVLMDVLGVGVLITGESGLGKSELALELISRGHGLVADDVVELACVGPHTIEGRCPQLLANLLEVRGLGLLDIKAIFGETAVRRKMRLRLIVHLVRRTTMDNHYQRMPLDVLAEEILGIQVRKVVIPVDMGRNIAVLAEAAVRNTILQLRGIDTMREFMDRQALEMRRQVGDAIQPADSDPSGPSRDPVLPRRRSSAQ
jgi:HPr kinase/phosphorylase